LNGGSTTPFSATDEVQRTGPQGTAAPSPHQKLEATLQRLTCLTASDYFEKKHFRPKNRFQSFGISFKKIIIYCKLIS